MHYALVDVALLFDEVPVIPHRDGRNGKLEVLHRAMHKNMLSLASLTKREFKECGR